MIKLYNSLLLILPFINEIINLIREGFRLPLWVYNANPINFLDIITKMFIDSLAIFGVLVNVLEIGLESCNIFIMLLLGLSLLLVSYIIPTAFLPLILNLNNKFKLYLGIIFILILYLIDNYIVIISKKYQNNIDKLLKNKRKIIDYKKRILYYYIFIIISIVQILYLSHYSLINKKNEYLGILLFILLLFWFFIIEKYLLI